MGKHRGKDEGIDPDSPEGVRMREEIPLDQSDERIARDIAILENGWNNTPENER